MLILSSAPFKRGTVYCSAWFMVECTRAVARQARSRGGRGGGRREWLIWGGEVRALPLEAKGKVKGVKPGKFCNS